MNLATYYAAMWVSQIWTAGAEDDTKRERYRTYCRVRAVVLFDRVMTGRVQVEP